MPARSIATRTGDAGDTGLLYGGRIRKTDLHIEACGAGDEAVSAMGLARSLSQDSWVKEQLLQVQRDMFTVNAELATDAGSRHLLEKHFDTVTPAMTGRVEALLARLESEVRIPQSFIIPGASPASSAMDLARTVVRRTERAAIALADSGKLANDEVLRYLNRLSDCIFMLARYEDRELPFEVLTGDRQ